MCIKRQSIDAVVTGQFASGDVIADEFFYRDSWLRDGTYSMIGLSLAGDTGAVDRYFDFWSCLLYTSGPAFYGTR